MAYLENRLSLKVQQKQVLTPALMQMVNLLTLNKLEMMEMIQQELVQNPVLEEGTEIVEKVDDLPDWDAGKESSTLAATAPAAERVDTPDSTDLQYATISDREVTVEQTVDTPPPEPADANEPLDIDIDFQSFDNYLNDTATRPRESEIYEKPSFENFLAKPATLTDHLEWQVGMVSTTEGVHLACHSIIGNLNEDGYLLAVDDAGKEVAIALEEIAESGEHPLEDVQAALDVVQRLDPPGVAARTLGECLMLQLRAMDEDDSIAADIIRDHLKKLQNRQFREIAKALRKTYEEIMEEIEIIKQLDPRPGQKYNNTAARTIEPDVFIVKVDAAGYTAVTNEDEVPQLRLSSRYRQMLERNALNKDAKSYVKDCFKSAMQLMKNIEQRKHIIVKVCEAVIRRQSDFLDNGIDFLKPMMIKDVAEEVGVHPSTVSRAVANKFAHTPQGVFELRFFFSEASSGPSGDATPLVNVKRKVEKLVRSEDPRKPLTDEKLVELLLLDGIRVTRRSVTKYREDLKIPSTHQRRQRD